MVPAKTVCDDEHEVDDPEAEEEEPEGPPLTEEEAKIEQAGNELERCARWATKNILAFWVTVLIAKLLGTDSLTTFNPFLVLLFVADMIVMIGTFFYGLGYAARTLFYFGRYHWLDQQAEAQAAYDAELEAEYA